jgi:hypothetical protein
VRGDDNVFDVNDLLLVDEHEHNVIHDEHFDNDDEYDDGGELRI